MVCLDQQILTPVDGMVTVYNTNTRQDEPKEAMTYPDLCHKPVGLFLQKEEYISRHGEIKERMNFYASFDVVTKRTAIEILDNTSANAVDKMIAYVKNKQLPEIQSPPIGSAKNPNMLDPLPVDGDNFDADIRF